ncbi:MAG: apolipoprotein N-acyltransferase [Spirochaetaceae bacterium]|nr:MAG: apolipoprotein N-acyltransferase [Spirochaetaceae bacterium]
MGLDLLLLAGSALLFALSFPSFLSQWGWFPLAFLALAPVFIVVHRAGWLRVVLYGAFFGFASYALYNYWLGSFHPLTLVIVPPIYSAYFLVAFPLLKAADSLFPRYGFLLQVLIWVAYEFAKVQGFLGYAYGIIGFSQYLFLPLARLASVTGIWGVSLIVVFPSALLGNALKNGFKEFIPFLRRHRLPALLYAAVFAAIIVYGLISISDLAPARKLKVALVQQNVDPWKGGNKTYAKTLEILTRLSRQALAEDPSIEVVVWSETSFVPAIDWHTRYRTDRVAFGLVKELREFLAEQSVPYVVGNDDGQLAKDEQGRDIRVDYNAAILFEGGEIIETYRKLHLVPFTEHFPFQRTLPGVYQWLRDADTHFWEKGTEYTVLEAAGVRFSTPICFEDTFAYLSRDFFLHGAEMLVNMTNDSWSKAVACEMQHMSIALFRALENKRTLVRSTNGGITCVIDPNGHITAMLAPFTEDYLIAEAPVYTAEQTLYTRWGDWFAWIVVILAVAVLAGGLIYRVSANRVSANRFLRP